MIKLENVSTDRLIRNIEHSALNNSKLFEMSGMLKKSNIRDYQELKDMLEGGKVDLGIWRRYLDEELVSVERDIEEANALGIEPQIFTFDNYENSSVDKETLRITDESNNGDVLLYTIPILHGGSRIYQLKRMTIDEIKHSAGHVSTYKFHNSFIYRRNFGMDTVSKVVDKVKLYEEQVLRQAAETDERGINLFMVNKEERSEIVREQLREIVQYIIDNAEECVWGKMSDAQKLGMMRAANASWGRVSLQEHQRLVDAISNYLTSSELKAGVVKTKKLDRFIVKKKCEYV